MASSHMRINVAGFLTLLLAVPCASIRGEAPVEFNRDVRPILSDACYACHGPDKGKRKAGFRLDIEKGAFADLGDGAHALVPGKLDQSVLYQRITSKDPKQHMPPPRVERQLTPREVDILRRWIVQGARWQPHWAFIPPRRPPIPAVSNPRWLRNPLDAFVLARLDREGLTPAPEADRVTLLRRVSFDLTGLPPTPAEVDAFLADRSPGAYERVVDRLLASPRSGERMAVRWLDAARYADTNGYQSDGERTMWRWRDWVIDTYNANLPFDRFTIEQLAGDLLPGSTLDQKIATGFNRNHRGNAEGGIIPEEYAVEYVADRVETTATVWLGLTMTCTRCHDHKYDPLKQKEFYQLFAYFNNVPERGKAVKYGNSPPFIATPTRAQQERRAALDRELAQAQARVKALEGRLCSAQAAWEKTLNRDRQSICWAPTEDLQAHFPLDRATTGPVAGAKLSGEAVYAPGKIGQAAVFDGKRLLEAKGVGNFGFYDSFTVAAWIYPQGPKGGAILSRMVEIPRDKGYGVHLVGGRVQVNLVVRWLDDAIRVETERTLEPEAWHHVLVCYDGSRVAGGVKVYVDGRPEKLRVLLDDLNQSFQTPEPFRIGSGGGPESRFHGRIDEVRVYRRALSADEVSVLATTETVDAVVRIPADRRTRGQALKVRNSFLTHAAPSSIAQAHQHLAELNKKRAALIASFPTTMVMQERPTPRDTFVLIRGQYDRPGAKVAPGVPTVLPPLAKGARPDRLGLARWLVDPGNPLTARVAVNRTWQMLFGIGLVKTVDDFGAQGEWPSHPELLDYLATEFVRSGWDGKRLLRTLVTSATYRQSSRVGRGLYQRDPENRLLARGPRFRLSAEMVRDNALAVSGLLVERIGGPSVKPYQPPGLWRDLADAEYTPDHGAGLYRRGLYTYWKRTVAPPALMTFDAAGRETCMVRQTRTNTPLQALNLLNDVTYVEAARVLAQRVLREAGPTPEERLTLAFRLATARRPRPAELRVLCAGLERHRAHYRKDRRAAQALVNAGEARRNEKIDVAELAAYTAMAGVILNLDEVITRE
jgi:hypothetical protein